MGFELKPDIDLNSLKDRFIEGTDYTKDEILEDLKYYQKSDPYFLVVTYDDEDFVIGHRLGRCFHIAQAWRRNDGDLKPAKMVIEFIKKWVKEIGCVSIIFHTDRNNMGAWRRFGFSEDYIVMRCKL